jgi:molybdate transport system substrate-binding protein
MPFVAIVAARGDIAILTHEAIDSLIRQGKAVGGSRLDLARFVIGIAVRKGAGKPDFSSPDTLPNQSRLKSHSVRREQSGFLQR